jgi:RsiW-degrading membrane proteinase PrsW (M82 family)
VLLLLGLVAFVAAAFLVERGAGIEGAVTLGPVPRIAFAALPALLWLGYFRARDSQEVEPRPLVLALFLGGALVAAPAAGFVIDLAQTSAVGDAEAFDRFGGARLVGAFLVIALAQELSKYLVVRYSVYPLPEVSHPVDGLIYATAVGLGFAAYRSHQLLAAQGDAVVLSVGAARVVTTTLAHACFASVLGLALGWAKFWPMGPLRRGLVLGGGLALATALNGTFGVVESAIAAPGLDTSPWRGVAFAFGFAALVLIAVSVPMRRMVATAARRAG